MKTEKLHEKMVSELENEIVRIRKQADGIYKLDTKLIEKALEVFESSKETALWLVSPIPSLGGKTPVGEGRTRKGNCRVMRVLSAIENGLFL